MVIAALRDPEFSQKPANPYGARPVLDARCRLASYGHCIGGSQWEESAMRTAILAYAIALAEVR